MRSRRGIAQIAADAQVSLPDGDFLEQLKFLSAALADQQAAAARREAARGQLRQFRQRRGGMRKPSAA